MCWYCLEVRIPKYLFSGIILDNGTTRNTGFTMSHRQSSWTQRNFSVTLFESWNLHVRLKSFALQTALDTSERIIYVILLSGTWPHILLQCFMSVDRSVFCTVVCATVSLHQFSCIVQCKEWLTDHTTLVWPILTNKERLVSELTRSDSWALDTNWNSLCVYNVGKQARSSDCIDTVFSVFKFIINIGCLWIGQIQASILKLS